jgi:hypothetical protein
MKKAKELLAKATAATEKPKRGATGANLVPYRFQSGQVANPHGYNHRAVILDLTHRMLKSSPPKELCLQIGVDPAVTWAEAIMFSLSKAAAQGDVAAAREVLAAMGFSGTQAKNILAVQNNIENTSAATEFLRRSHGLSEDSLQAVYKFMDSLPRETPVVDASYFPDEAQQ